MTRRTAEPGSQPRGVATWLEEPADVGSRGLARERTATAAERAALAAELDLLGCEEVVATYRLRQVAGGGYHMSGRVRARVAQACVVSLDPVVSVIDEALDVEFREPRSAPGSSAHDPLADADYEPLDARGRLPVGRVFYDYIAAALDPYPRAPGVELEGPADSQAERTSAFAALGKLKGGE